MNSHQVGRPPSKLTLAVSGPSAGGTSAQMEIARYLITGPLRPVRLHHGDCIGFDAAMHQVVRNTNPSCWIVVHPATVPITRRAYCPGNEMWPLRPPLDRDDDIAREGDLLLAAVRHNTEFNSAGLVRRGDGAWATIRRARRHRRPIWIIHTDGTIKIELPQGTIIC
jgi:hypothetical protein